MAKLLPCQVVRRLEHCSRHNAVTRQLIDLGAVRKRLQLREVDFVAAAYVILSLLTRSLTMHVRCAVGAIAAVHQGRDDGRDGRAVQVHIEPTLWVAYVLGIRGRCTQGLKRFQYARAITMHGIGERHVGMHKVPQVDQGTIAVRTQQLHFVIPSQVMAFGISGGRWLSRHFRAWGRDRRADGLLGVDGM